MKVKIFSKYNPLGKKGARQLDLQNEINNWIENNPSFKIMKTEQTTCGGSFERANLFISVWYE